MKLIKKILSLSAGIITALAMAGLVASTIALIHQAPSAYAQAADPEAIETRFSGGSHVAVIPGAAFRFTGASSGESPTFSILNGYWTGNTSNAPCLTAPVYLPPNVIIKQVSVTFYNNDSAPSTAFWMTLYRVENYSGQVTIMTDLTSTTKSTQVLRINSPSVYGGEVEYPTYQYYLATCLNSAQIRLYSARVAYEYSYETYLPLLVR
jgi:hypothetical protein